MGAGMYSTLLGFVWKKLMDCMPCGLVLFSIATHTVFSRLLHYYTLLRGLEPKN